MIGRKVRFAVLVAVLFVLASAIPTIGVTGCMGGNGWECFTCWTIDWGFPFCTCVPVWDKGGACICCQGGGTCWTTGDGCYAVIVR